MLDMNCCDPQRSQRFAELGATIAEARMKLRVVTISSETTGPAARQILEAAGAQAGRLQVGCCNMDRMGLFAEILQNLAKARITIDKVLADTG